MFYHLINSASERALELLKLVYVLDVPFGMR